MADVLSPEQLANIAGQDKNDLTTQIIEKLIVQSLPDDHYLIYVDSQIETITQELQALR